MSISNKERGIASSSRLIGSRLGNRVGNTGTGVPGETKEQGLRLGEFSAATAQSTKIAQAKKKKGNQRINSSKNGPSIDGKISINFEGFPNHFPEKPKEVTKVAWHDQAKFYEVRSVRMKAGATVNISNNEHRPSPRELWVIGFVQNLLVDDITYKYIGFKEKCVLLRRQLLDQIIVDEKPFDDLPALPQRHADPFVYPVPKLPNGERAFSYFQRGDGDLILEMNIEDAPCVGFFNSKPGASRAQLQWVKHRMVFGLWLLARENTMMPRSIRSYQILDSCKWWLEYTFEVEKGPSFWKDPIVLLSPPEFGVEDLDGRMQPKLGGKSAQQLYDKRWADILYVHRPCSLHVGGRVTRHTRNRQEREQGNQRTE